MRLRLRLWAKYFPISRAANRRPLLTRALSALAAPTASLAYRRLMPQTNRHGGTAAEGGSLHRAGAAALLAARGLVSAGVVEAGFSLGGPTINKITLEARSAVDDIVCNLDDGSTWYIQAKRSCGNDQHLRDSITQWIEQRLEPGDWVGLAVRSPRGIVRHLGSGLDNLRDNRALTVREDEAVQKFTEIVVGLGGPLDLVAATRILVSEAEDDRDRESVAASSLLSSTVVAAGQGEAAFRALRSHFHHLSASGGSSSPRQWVDVLRDQHLDLVADPSGPTGQKLAAMLRVDDHTRKKYLAEKNYLELALFADDLPPVFVPDLLDLYQITVEDEDYDRGMGIELAPFARSVQKFVLEGLPGSGKSTALYQLAAAWASDPECPTPLYVQLRYVADRVTRRSDVTLRLLVEGGLGGVEGVTPGLVDSKVASLLLEDHWTLILDGLDETAAKRGVITDGLLDILDTIPNLAGLVLATRHTASGAVRKLNLPTVELRTPKQLEAVLSGVVDHVAIHRGHGEDWIRSKRIWLHQQLRRPHALWAIPLTATLMTLAHCRDAGFSTSSKGVLLRQGIDDAVQRWELANKSYTEAATTYLTADILLFTFAMASRMLIQEPNLSAGHLSQLVQTELQSTFGTSILQSRAATAAAFDFWTERMGLFVTSGIGIAPRHRQIAEVGDAMWVENQPADVQMDWLQRALADDTSRDRVELATDLNPSLLVMLVDPC